MSYPDADLADWNACPWWFETPELFVLTGSMGYFRALPKSGAEFPEGLARARNVCARYLRRI
ncbi:hypothetical protein [Streptomyces sp. NPDC054838]